MQKENSQIKQPKKRISPIVVPTIEEETSKKASPKKVQNSDKKATSKTKTSPTKKTV